MNYKVVIKDNFFSPKHFNQLINLKLLNKNKNSISVFHNIIKKNGKIITNVISTDLIRLIHRTYHKKIFKILQNLNYKKSKLYEYSDISIIITGKNYKFPVHDDNPDKLLSGVIYLKPKKNSGTFFYLNRKGKPFKQIKWKQNRAVFFSREEQKTWHSYEGDGQSNRVAIVYNLKTSKIKKVFNIEKKNYFVGALRYFLNPYLYRWFSFMV